MTIEQKPQTPSPAQSSRALQPIDQFRQVVTQMMPQFELALPAHVSVKKFARVLVTAVQQTPALLECERASLLGAALRAAQDGLLPDGREAAITKFNSKGGPPKAQYMPMVGGIMKKVRNSGELSSITSQIVRRNDKFRYWVDGDGEHVEHEPNLFSDRGDVIGVYALAKTKDGGIYIESMTKADVEAVRKVSRAANDGPWVTWWEEMARKTAIRRLSKRLPMSTDLEVVIRADDDLSDLERAGDRGVDVTPDAPPAAEPVPTPEPPKASRLATAVKAAVAPAAAAPAQVKTPEVLPPEPAPREPGEDREEDPVQPGMVPV